MKIRHGANAVLVALAAPALFGASTPLTKQFVGDMSALLLAGWCCPGPALRPAPAIAAAGLWLHLTERHKHPRFPDIHPRPAHS